MTRVLDVGHCSNPDFNNPQAFGEAAHRHGLSSGPVRRSTRPIAQLRCARRSAPDREWCRPDMDELSRDIRVIIKTTWELASSAVRSRCTFVVANAMSAFFQTEDVQGVESHGVATRFSAKRRINTSWGKEIVGRTEEKECVLIRGRIDIVQVRMCVERGRTLLR